MLPKVRSMVRNQRFEGKILITTSVLDNGVTLKDPEIRNLVIITENKTSFLQMLGRVRSDGKQIIDLIFLERTPDYFAWKANRLEGAIRKFKYIAKAEWETACIAHTFTVMNSFWDNKDETELSTIRKVYFPLKGEETKTFYLWDRLESNSRSSVLLVRNPFAEVKIKNLYDLLQLYIYKAAQDPKEVIYQQMEWLGKSREDLIALSQVDEASILQIIASRITALNNTSRENYKNAMTEITRDYLQFFRIKFSDKSIRSDRPLKSAYLDSLLNEIGITIKEEDTTIIVSEVKNNGNK